MFTSLKKFLFEPSIKRIGRDGLRIGDVVEMSTKNPNHLGYGVDAYAGMKGVVDEIFECGGFVLNCKDRILVVPTKYGKIKKYLIVNGVEVLYSIHN